METMVEACVRWDCQKPAIAPSVWCAAHATEASGPPGVTEPALEARLAAMPDPPAPDPPPILDQGDWAPTPPRDTRRVYDDDGTSHEEPVPLAYIQACLAGRHGAIAKMMAEAMVKATAAALADL